MDEFYKMRSGNIDIGCAEYKGSRQRLHGNTQIKVFFKKDDVDTLCNDGNKLQANISLEVSVPVYRQY